MKPEIYISVDIETDGPIPGANSMLSIGAVAYDESLTMLGTFTANLQPMALASQDPKTMGWWATQPEAWAACQKDARLPIDVTREFVAWCESLGGRPIVVAYPTGFDFTFVKWYAVHYTGRDPFNNAAIDLRSLAMGHLGVSYTNAKKSRFPGNWKTDAPHTHVALDDAMEQGALFVAIMKAIRSRTAGDRPLDSRELPLKMGAAIG